MSVDAGSDGFVGEHSESETSGDDALPVTEAVARWGKPNETTEAAGSECGEVRVVR